MSSPSDHDYVSKGLSSALRRIDAASGHNTDDLRRLAAAFRASDDTEGPEEDPTSVGPYPVLECLGRGGVGRVYRSTDPKLGRSLAIKVLAARFASEPDMAARFRAEARVCSRLQHPGIVPIYEIGELEDGRPFFTMKIIEGETLAELIAASKDEGERRRRFLEVFEMVCQTVAFAHSEGVVHGDLKPSNVMVGAFGEIQVMDWGFARSVDEQSDSDSGATRVLGTPAYMAPEQARGDQTTITYRTDVFGLGAMLCEILTGKPPYDGDGRHEIYLRAAQGWLDPACTRLRESGAERGLVDLAMRCLSVAPGDRPESASAVGAEISGYLESLETRLGEARAVATQERRARRLGTALAFAVATIVIVGAIGWGVVQAERSAKAQENARAVGRALERAMSLHEQARAQPRTVVHRWAEALAAAKQARDFAESNSLDVRVRSEAQELVRTLERERGEAQRTLAMLSWLQDVRPHLGDDRKDGGVDAAYAAGFAKFGFVLGGAESGELATRVADSGLVLEITSAMGDWLRIRKQLKPDTPAFWQPLFEVVQKADPDPIRTELRTAGMRGDAAALLAIVRSGKLDGAPPQTANLLAKFLQDCEQKQTAIDVLRAQVARHPGDFWMLHDLARMLGDAEQHQAERIGLLRAVAAARPESAHALTDFSHALISNEKAEQAVRVLARATTCDPGYGRAWRYLAWANRELRRFTLAAKAADRAIEIDAEDFEAHRIKANASWQLGDFASARAHAVESVRLGPDHYFAHIVLGTVCMHMGDDLRALEAFSRAHELRPENSEVRVDLAYCFARQLRFSEAFAALGQIDDPQVWKELSSLRDATERIDEVLAGQFQPDPTQLVWFADVAHRKGEHEAAVRLYRHADPATVAKRRLMTIASAAEVGRTGQPKLARGARQLARRSLLGELRGGRTLLRDRGRDPAQLLGWCRAVQAHPSLQPYWTGGRRFLSNAERSAWDDVRRELDDFAGALLEAMK